MACNTTGRDTNEFNLPVPKRNNVGLCCEWGLGKQLYVYETQIPPANTKGVGELDLKVNQPMIYNVRWNAEMHDIARKLVNESHNIFVMLQGQVKSLSESSLDTQLRKASKHYRGVLKACTIELAEKAENCDDESRKRKYESYIQEFEIVELIWSLCQIIFIDGAPGGLILPSLLDWLRWHFTEGKQLIMEIFQDELPFNHPKYWEAVFRLLLQGSIEDVRKLLSLHNHSESDAFVAVEELLRKMPVLSYQHSQSAAEFGMKWRQWRDECIRRYEAGEFAAYAELEMVVQVLCGDEAVFRDLKDQCETWYHMLVSKLLFQEPTARVEDLTFHIKSCQAVFNQTNLNSQKLDDILQSAMEFDIHQVITDTCTFLSNPSWWFVAHLADLLHHCGQLDTRKLQFGSNLREYLLLEYATALMSHESLWQVGVDYLDFCPVFGSSYLESYIEHIALDNERKALKVLHICEERKLSVQAQSVCKVMGMKCLRQERLGSALSWFLRSKDPTVIKDVTDKFLTEYFVQGKFSHLDLLDNLGPSMLATNSLTFLGKYREFHTLYDQGDLEAATSLLLSLISSRLAPKSFWLTLLMDAFPLLKLPKPVLNVQQTYEIMHCLEELQQDGMKKATSMTESEAEKVKTLQRALTTNLSRALIQEASVGVVQGVH